MHEPSGVGLAGDRPHRWVTHAELTLPMPHYERVRETFLRTRDEAAARQLRARRRLSLRRWACACLAVAGMALASSWLVPGPWH